ncbi:MAG: hypothetical protein R2798_04650 [Chitinophagales bacterium]
MEENRDFAQISFGTFDIEHLGLNETLALNFLTEEINTKLTELNKAETKEKRWAFLKIPHTKPDDFAEIQLQIADTKKIIAGIRHFNQQKDKAFVAIQTNFITHKEELKDIYKQYLGNIFGKFSPQYLRYFTRQKIAADKIGSCFMVQRIATILEESPYAEEQNITLISPQNAAYYTWYEKEYQKFHLKNPSLAHSVPVNDLAYMENSRAINLLKEVHYNGQVIGLIAGIEETFLGHAGIYMAEILLKESWKGLGLAKVVQRKYLREINMPEKIVWGTIDFANKPSLHTALANKREAIHYENFIKIT